MSRGEMRRTQRRMTEQNAMFTISFVRRVRGPRFTLETGTGGELVARIGKAKRAKLMGRTGGFV